MLFHMSISAQNPERVARVIAELWQGHAFPWGRGWWMAMAGDDRNTAIEIYPHGFVLTPNKDEKAQWPAEAAALRMTATHAAIATPLSEEEVCMVARREGWLARYLRRGDKFGVIEFWLENAVLLEVMTSEMVKEYLDTQTVEQWRLQSQPSQTA